MSRHATTVVKDLLGYKLKKTQHALRIRMDEALRSLNLTTPQYSVLAQLELKPGISNAELARAAFITAQTMHGIVSNLEKRSLLKRQVTPNHGRILSTTLTAEGSKLVQQAHHLIMNIEENMMRTITAEQKDLLEQILSECSHNLK